jgi:hypothetical protein
LKKASDSTSQNGEDDTALEELDHENGEEYAEPEADDGDDIDPAVQSSDSAIIDEVAAEAVADDSLPQLTREQINLGQFSLSKVWINVRATSPFADQ